MGGVKPGDQYICCYEVEIVAVLHLRDGHTTTFLQVERFNTSEIWIWSRHSRSLTDEAMTVASEAAAWYEKAKFTFYDAITVINCKPFFHTPRPTQCVRKIHLAYSNECYTRFASTHTVQSRAQISISDVLGDSGVGTQADDVPREII